MVTAIPAELNFQCMSSREKAWYDDCTSRTQGLQGRDLWKFSFLLGGSHEKMKSTLVLECASRNKSDQIVDFF